MSITLQITFCQKNVAQTSYFSLNERVKKQYLQEKVLSKNYRRAKYFFFVHQPFICWKQVQKFKIPTKKKVICNVNFLAITLQASSNVMKLHNNYKIFNELL